MEKKCTKCEQVKSLEDFYNHTNTKFGKRHECKICSKERSKELYKINKESRKESHKKYREKNKEAIKEYNKKNKETINDNRKKWEEKNKKTLINYGKMYREKNKETKKEYMNKYRQDNKEKIRETTNNYRKIRKVNDALFRLTYTIRNSICKSLKDKGYSKKTNTYKILKCEFSFFMNWLNGVASNGYTYGIGDLHLDHVIPISLAETEDEALLLCHYSNYQLLSADENFSKGNRYVNPTNLKRVLEHHPTPDKIREIHARL